MEAVKKEETKSEDTLLKELRLQHGDVGELRDNRTGSLVAVFRVPRIGDYQRFMEIITGDKSKLYTAGKELALCSVVHPERDELKAAFERRPGYIIAATGLLQSLSGAEAEATVKAE